MRGRVFFFSNHKRLAFLVVAFCAWILTGPLLCMAAIGALFVHQWFAFHEAVSASRKRRRVVLASDNASVQKAIELIEMDDPIISAEEFDPWRLLEGSHDIVLVVGNEEAKGFERLWAWLLQESETRIIRSQLQGWNTNIVYTAEGYRRNAFLRISFTIVGNSQFGRDLGELLEALGAQQRRQHQKLCQRPSEERLGFREFFQWIEGCPCCTQRYVESTRLRSSHLRTNLLDLIRLSSVEPTIKTQLLRAGGKMLKTFTSSASSLFRSSPSMLPYSHDLQQASLLSRHPGTEVYWLCAWGDARLLDSTTFNSNSHHELYQVSTDFRIVNGLGQSVQHQRWIWEAAGRFPGFHIVITHPLSKAELAYQIVEEDTLAFLQGLVPGQPAQECEHATWRKWLIASGLWILKEKHDDDDGEDTSATTERMANDLATQGFTVIAADYLIPRVYLNALRRYSRSIHAWFMAQGMVGDESPTWNDEAVARQMQHTLTYWAESIAREQLLSSGLALSIFIKSGRGFVYHTDTSPPFDLTLDLVVDHEGTSSRPIYFSRKDKARGVISSKLELKYGESVLFRGGELTHWGGDLGSDSSHLVQLYTWQFARE